MFLCSECYFCRGLARILACKVGCGIITGWNEKLEQRQGRSQKDSIWEIKSLVYLEYKDEYRDE